MTFKQAVRWAGSQANLARLLRCHEAQVSRWKAAGRLPLARQYQIEILSAGRLKAARK